MHDKINHPKHYTQGIECWDYITSHKMGYLEGNIIKYVTRYKYKDGLDDLFKAKAYLTRLIEEQFGPPIMVEPSCPMKDVAPCNLDGRNCGTGHPASCEAKAVVRINGAIPLRPIPDCDCGGGLPHQPCQLDGRNCGLDHSHGGANGPSDAADPDMYCLGDYQRPADWMKRRYWISE